MNSFKITAKKKHSSNLKVSISNFVSELFPNFPLNLRLNIINIDIISRVTFCKSSYQQTHFYFKPNTSHYIVTHTKVVFISFSKWN